MIKAHGLLDVMAIQKFAPPISTALPPRAFASTTSLSPSPCVRPAAPLFSRVASPHNTAYTTGSREGNTGPDAASYLQDEICYTDILSEHGWTCGLSGKWHLGNSTLPQHGFSHWFAHEKGGGPYNDATLVRNGELVTVPGYVTTAITDDALAFIDNNDDNPFYLSVHYTAPHSPWTGHPQDIVDSYDDCPFESCPQEDPHPWAGGLER